MRPNRVLSLMALLLLAAGCGREATLIALAQPPAASVVALRDAKGVTLLDTETDEVVTRVVGGVASRDWVFQSRLTAAGTQVSAISGRGERTWSTDLRGDLSVRVASHDGSLVALLPYDAATVDPYNPVGRIRTRITVAPTGGGEARPYDLIGNFEPEAFSTSGRSLFVVEYVPAEAPASYRVRKLDLETGTIRGVLSVDGHLQDSMQGTARVSAMAPDGSRLYTLYTTVGLDGPKSFVHVLDLDEEWAHCVDLPGGVGTSSEPALTIVAMADTVRVYDEQHGVAHIDPATLAVDEVTPPITLPSPTASAVVDPAGDRLWLVGSDAIYAVQPLTWFVLQTLPLPDGVEPIVAPPPDERPIQCAC